MRINIAASHRFHLLDLARELSNLGHEVRFYSFVPTNRSIKYGLTKQCSYSLFYLMMPFLVMTRLSKRADWSVKLLNNILDLYLTYFMKPCDVYIALGTVYKYSIAAAKKRFGATTILEWGSKHNSEQQRILEEIPGFKPQNEYFKKRALDGYKFADYIAIPSNHVRQSFIDRNIDEKKLLQVPYGVDLSMFGPTKLINEKQFDVIMVGGWSYVKGADLLIDFFKNSTLKFLHVGPIVDLKFPNIQNMVHIEPVDQKSLINYYSKAKIFVLPSRAEGMAMVQAQALACGLPIVCSRNTGGVDLKSILTDKKWIIEMVDFSIHELEECIQKALKLAETQKNLRSYINENIELLSWTMYAKKYEDILHNIIAS